MPVVHQYNVVPSLPPELRPLEELAYNLHWSWDHDIIDAFRRLDRDLWEASGQNPALLLGSVSQDRLAQLARDDAYLAYLDRVYRLHQEQMSATTWWSKAHGQRSETCIAYFSAEYGLCSCVPIYSGGLGVLSGDHVKSSSELGIPLAGVGLLYQQGYFRQYLNADGWQQELYPENDFYNMPLVLERDAEGRPVTVTVGLPGREVYVQIWRVQVGRVPLYLLDTNMPRNSTEDQDITDQLYGGGREMRIRQEIVLGIGGVRALAALGIRPTVCHMNEGHSAFQALERIRQSMRGLGIGFAEARELCAAGNVFTTHTPVPAGFDLFPREVMVRYFTEFARELGIAMDTLLALGRTNPADVGESFNMATLAINSSEHINGVSKLHGQTSRSLVQVALPDVPRHEIAVGSITNGVHTRSWLSRDMTELLNRYLGQRWQREPADQTVWRRVDQIPNEELWRTHERRRERLVALARHRLYQQLLRRGASKSAAAVADEVLNPSALTIGFARRFATYKRATLVLRDVARIQRILLDHDRPVQILFAGKAHPHDDAGKELIRQIVHVARVPELRRRIVFLEDYDIALARYMVQGVDLWLNTPRRPQEASGTSGMKVVFNGGLNMSILDGWWAEGYRPDLGWAIGRGEEYQDHEYQDRVESEALYDLLEKEVVPTFYDRSADGLPRRWIEMMKTSMRELGPVFNTNRMIHEYTERAYIVADERYRALAADSATRATALAHYKKVARERWSEVSIREVAVNKTTDVQVGDHLVVRATVRLGSLEPGQVAVQLYDGPLDAELKIPNGAAFPMEWKRQLAHDGTHEYEGAVPCEQSGRRGFTVRVLPAHPDLLEPQMMGLVRWE